jgi:hypothetical protein
MNKDEVLQLLKDIKESDDFIGGVSMEPGWFVESGIAKRLDVAIAALSASAPPVGVSRDDVLEEAARVCEEQEEPPYHGFENPNSFNDGKWACAAAIRALKTGAAIRSGAGEQPVALDVDQLANFIRRINGNNDMGAGALAENILGWLRTAPVSNPKEPSDTAPIGEASKTARGFDLIEFTDRYDVACSIQKSSLAFEDAIWLGCSEAKPRQLIPGKGWQDIEMPADYCANTRMHLTQEQVAWLLPILQNFVLTGELAASKAMAVDTALVQELPPLPEPMQDKLAEMEARKDAAYLERNQVVAALARCFPSGIADTAIEGWSADWHGCVYIDLPTGQVSWHFHDSHAHLFEDLPQYDGKWDGHDTPEKYRRLAALSYKGVEPKPHFDHVAGGKPEADTRFEDLVRDRFRNSKLFRMFLDQGFWHANFVNFQWRYNGQYVYEEADWIKDIWYALRGRYPGDPLPPEAAAQGGQSGREAPTTEGNKG